MSAHTPGPWIGVDEDGKFNSKHEWSAEHESAASSTSAPVWADGKVVALVVSASNRFSWDDSELAANARLIAAAPELLEALIAAVKYSDAMHRAQAHIDGETVDYETFAPWRAVIAKATGATA